MRRCIILVSDVRSPLAMKRGYIKKRDYEYKRKGSCNVFCVIEPKGRSSFDLCDKESQDCGVCESDKEDREDIFKVKEDSYSVG